MTVIAMPREMGTLGKDVALGVAEKLGIEVVHRELIERDVAERMNVGENAVHQFLEGRPSLWNRWKIDSAKLSRYTAEEMLGLAAGGNVLIRGWGAVSLLRRVPHVLCVRVCAPLNFRAKVLKDRLGLESEDVARREIEKNDKAHLRSAQLRNVSDWTNSTNFDLVINSHRVPVEQGIEMVSSLATSDAFNETAASKMVLSDILLETRIKNNLAKKENGNLLSHGLDVYVVGGDVVLTGAVADNATAEKAYLVAGGTSGVRKVERNVTVLSSPYGRL